MALRHSPSEDAARVREIKKAIRRLDAVKVRKLAAAHPELLRANPDVSAQMLSWALRCISFAPSSSMTVRGEAAREQLEGLRATFDALIDAGASVNCPAGLEDLPPLFVSV